MPDQVELPDLALFRLPDGAGERNPVADVPPEPLGEVPADDGALPIGKPRLHLVGRQAELRIDFEERLGLDGDVGEKVRRILVDAVEPGLVRRQLDARRLLQASRDRSTAAA